MGPQSYARRIKKFAAEAVGNVCRFQILPVDTFKAHGLPIHWNRPQVVSRLE